MAIRLRMKEGPFEFIEADSAEELASAYQQFLRANGRKGRMPIDVPSASGANEALPANALKLVRLLLPKPQGMNSHDVARELGVEPRGLGGFVTSLSNWGRRHNLTKKQIITKERRANGHGHLVRNLALTDRFRQMIQDGKIKGLTMKLDT